MKRIEKKIEEVKVNTNNVRVEYRNGDNMLKIKRGRKKIKMDIYDFMHFLDRNNNGYYDYYSVKIIKEGKVIRGMLYKLTKSLSDEDKEYLLKWKNTDLCIVSPLYAKEIKNNAVVLFNNCIR